MLSCTEFIPFYNELFKYIESEKDHDAVVRFWYYISDNYVAQSLEPKIREKGMMGIWEHWTQITTEEACDCRREFDTEKNEITSHMRKCPSKSHLLEMKHIKPYWDYCNHCAVLYSRIFEKYGIVEERDHSHTDRAECFSRKYLAKKPGVNE